MLEIITSITMGRGTQEQLGETVAWASLYRLGKSAPNPVPRNAGLYGLSERLPA